MSTPRLLKRSSRGVLITARRLTWLGLRPTQRFVPAEEIRDVYREANAVQVHLHGSRSAYFRLWAEDSASAAQIIELLPTKHTIEFENAIHEPQLVIAWRMPAIVLAVLLAVVCLVVLAWAVEHRGPAAGRTKNTTLPQSQLAAPTVKPRASVPTAEPRVLTTGNDGLLAEQDLRVFGARIDALSNEFKMAWEALQEGTVTQERFADEMDQWLRPQWDALESRLRRTDAAKGSLRERADQELMGVISNWQLALYSYADDLRNQRQVVKSFEYLKLADQYLQRAQQMQSDLRRHRIQ